LSYSNQEFDMCCSFDSFSDPSRRPAALDATVSGDSNPTARVRTATRRPLRSLLAAGAAVIVALAVTAAAMVAGATEPTHEITLVARDMAFFLPDGTTPNPAIEVAAEEQVRMTLVNRDAGIDHDLAVSSLGVQSEAIPGNGAQTTIEFRAPRTPGVHEYVCRLHGRMMRGQLTVR
jgi:plastocyanin